MKAYFKEDKWYIKYLGKSFDMDIYFETILKYVGISGWELIHTTILESERTESFYFKRATNERIKFSNQKLFSKIDQFSHFASAKLESEIDEGISDKAAGKKLIAYFYDWLKNHHFKWDDPAPGANESHYLVMMEDASKIPQFFDESEEFQNVTTRIDVDRTSKHLVLHVQKRVKGDTWYETSKFRFSLDKTGLDSIRYMFGNHHTWINRLNGLDKF
ncbi:MAG: hypothetical protein DRG24_08570 [Epsilonproteobacteria bacterium]|nr:MAG: hypothetical protein DRG24_08570 [Campylobacterota bacterium]